MSDNKDAIVERVLHGLRDAAPPDGMDSRLISALQHRASTMPVPTRAPWRTASLTGSALFAALICAVSIATHRRTPQASAPRPQTISMQASNGNIAPPVSAERTAPERPVHQTSIHKIRSATFSQKEDSTVVSYPAPPMPLTDQEKLLLRLAHEGDPVQMAMLDPLQRDARYAEAREQFQRFFAPSISGENK